MRAGRVAAALLGFSVVLQFPALAHAGKTLAIGAVSSVDVVVPEEDRGGLAHFGSGVGGSIVFVESRCGCPGVELSTIFLVGDEGERLYNLGLGFMASFSLRPGKLATPFVSFGLDLSAATIPSPTGRPDAADRWVTLGVHGNLGLHGFLTDRLYWRAQAGFLGAGVGGLTAGLTLGWVFGEM